MRDQVVLDGSDLRIEQIVAIAQGSAAVSLSEDARRRVEEADRFADEVARSRPVYGRSTGVGANRTVAVEDPQLQAMALLRSHATAAGPVRSRERVRAMVAVRLGQLCAGRSGIGLPVVDGLSRMLAEDALPAVRELGSIGTADLPAFALVGLALAGEEPTDPPLTRREPIGIGDALAMMSSNAAALADAALATARLRSLADAAIVVVALTHAAVDGNAEAFSVLAQEASPFAGVRAVSGTVRRLVGGSGQVPSRIQDPFGLRVAPQVHGAALDRLLELEQVVTLLVNTATENPLIVPGAGIAHHGGFHAVYLAQALDAARSAVAQTAGLGTSRLGMLTSPEMTGLPSFLASGRPGASGVMVLEYVAADALAKLRAMAQPFACQSASLSHGVEEDASFAAQAAAAALAATDLYEAIISCELVAAVRCLRMRATELPHGLRDVLAECAALPDDVSDRSLTDDLEIARGLLPNLAQFAALE